MNKAQGKLALITGATPVKDALMQPILRGGQANVIAPFISPVLLV
jgi:hypothetical protein